MSQSTGQRPKCRIGMLSLGCPKTLVDSELILGKLDPSRYAISDSVVDCDVALVNTCAFIREAQEESIDQILKLVELKRTGAIGKLIVLGCLPQRFLPELQSELKEVDAFVGTGEYTKISVILNKVVSGNRVTEVGTPGYLYTSAERRISLGTVYSRYLKLSEGCDHACSFCVIPSFRGPYRSRTVEDVVEEAAGLVEEGAREVILTGQDTTFFGYDLGGRYLLPKLLRQLNAIPKLKWIRILYAYPSLVGNELIEAIAALDKVCHYLDVPFQHVNDRILQSMCRGTTHRSICRLIDNLRQRIPDLAIRTTFIVGYPGETEREFAELLNFLEEFHLERVGIFTYSPEEGSPAFALPAQLPVQIKRRRLEAAMRMQQAVSRWNNQRLMGRDFEVLVEEKDDRLGWWLGRTYMDAPEVDGTVRFFEEPTLAEGRSLKPGDFVSVEINEAREYDLVGKIASSVKG